MALTIMALLTVTPPPWAPPRMGSAVTKTSSSSSSSSPQSSLPCCCFLPTTPLRLLDLATVALDPAGVESLLPLPFQCHHWDTLSPWLLLRRRLSSAFQLLILVLRCWNLEASLDPTLEYFSSSSGPLSNPASSSSSSASFLTPASVDATTMDFDLAMPVPTASPEEKLAHRFLILRHFRASVPPPLVDSGVGAIVNADQAGWAICKTKNLCIGCHISGRVERVTNLRNSRKQ